MIIFFFAISTLFLLAKLQHQNHKINSENVAILLKNNSLTSCTFRLKRCRKGAKRCKKEVVNVMELCKSCRSGIGKFWKFLEGKKCIFPVPFPFCKSMVRMSAHTICSNYNNWYKTVSSLVKRMYGNKVWPTGNLQAMYRNFQVCLERYHRQCLLLPQCRNKPIITLI